MAPLTDVQEIVLGISQMIPSAASICGSFTLTRVVLFSKKPASVYNRILVLMSVMDIMFSTSLFLAPFLVPKSGGRIWAVGNEQTCSMLGFFGQFGSSVTLYNASLNIYYLSTIVYSITDQKFTKLIEPWLHVFSLGFPLITASVGAGIHLFSENEIGITCWISEYPIGCLGDPDTPCISDYFGWVYSGIPYLSTFFFLILSNILIYRNVKKSMLQTRRYSFASSVSMSSHDTGTRRSRPSQRVSLTSIQQRLPRRSSTMTQQAPLSSGQQRLRTVGAQCTMYVCASFVTVIWMMTLRILESSGIHREDESNVYWIVLFATFCFPSHGLWNLLIFIRPKYARWRRREPERSKWWAFKQSISLQAVPPGGRMSYMSSRAGHRNSNIPMHVNQDASNIRSRVSFLEDPSSAGIQFGNSNHGVGKDIADAAKSFEQDDDDDDESCQSFQQDSETPLKGEDWSEAFLLVGFPKLDTKLEAHEEGSLEKSKSDLSMM